MTRRSRLTAPAFAALLAACAAALSACDPPPAEDLILGPAPVVRFAVEKVTPGDGSVAADAPLVIRFTQDVDVASVGSKSILVTRAGGRRPFRVRAWGSGREMRVAPLPGRAFPVDEPLLLHLDGAPSPRAMRSASGEPLAQQFEMAFRAGPARADLSGPRLLGSSPRDAADDVAPGSTIELRFDEPIARGAVVTGDAVTLRVDGVAVAATLELSGNASTVVVHPGSPLPPDRRVEVELHECVLDFAGNPLDAASPRGIAFRTSARSLHELVEDFVDSAKYDVCATSCGWDDPESPGVLVARSGTVLVAPETGAPDRALAGAASLHFQLLVPASDVPTGLASALRIEFASAPEDARVLGALVEAGRTWLDVREPSFVTNRGAAELRTVARITEPVDVEAAGATGPGAHAAASPAFVDLVFEEPLRLERGKAVLLDVHLELTPGILVAAYTDAGTRALVEGNSDVVPAASLVVSPSTPQARSLWYDTGVAVPGWRACSVVRPADDPGVRTLIEFQSAPGGADGGPDTSRSTPWESDLARLPAYRFVRFRLRFDGTPENASAPRIDRIVLPYER